jgi:hypothetical protein
MTLSAVTARKRSPFRSIMLAAASFAILSSAGAAPSFAQTPPAVPPPVQVSREVATPLNEGLKALQAKDYVTAKAKLDAAAAAAKTPQDKYQVERIRVPLGQESKDWANLAIYLQNALDTGLLSPEDTKRYKYGFVTVYANLGDNAKALPALRSYLDEYGGTAEQFTALAGQLQAAKDPAATGYLEKAVEAARAAGQKPPENTYRVLLGNYDTAKASDKYLTTLETLAAEYPKDQYWGLLVQEATRAPGYQAALADIRMDLYRTQFAAGMKLTPQQVAGFGAEADRRGLVAEGVAILTPLAAELNAEAKATLTSITKKANDEKAGLAKEETEALKGTGSRLAKFGEVFLSSDPAKAADLIQKAIAKGIPDAGEADLAKLHLGIAQYRAGQKDAAQATWSEIKADNGAASLARTWKVIAKVK